MFPPSISLRQGADPTRLIEAMRPHPEAIADVAVFRSRLAPKPFGKRPGDGQAFPFWRVERPYFCCSDGFAAGLSP